MTLTDIAERAKTSTEASARARITWEDLQKLASAMMEAKKAYMYYGMVNANSVNTPDLQIQFDLDKNGAEKRYLNANTAYQSALKRYQEQQS